MRGSSVVLSLFITVLAAGAGCRAPEDGTAESSVTVGGRQRAFLYHLPPSHGSEPEKTWPLIVALHGRGGDGIQAEKGTALTDLAKREGLIVAYPDGIDESWNDRRAVGPAADQGVDDVGFIRALIDKEIAEHRADPKRVFVAGISNGGMMTFRLACELSDKIAAVGTVIALMPENGAEQCSPGHPMPIVMFAGTEDPLMPYGGGDVASNRGRVLSASASRERWATINGCEPIDIDETLDPEDDDTRVFRTAHTRCLKGSEVILFSIDGGGHTWPNGDQYLPKAVIGKVTRDIDGANELWAFFRRHALAAQ